MRRFVFLGVAVLVLVLAACSQQPMTPVDEASPGALRPLGDPTELFFSEVIEGSSNNKALEIYNGTGAAVDLAAGGYHVQMFFNGNSSAGLTLNLVGTVAHGDVFVIAHASAAAAVLAHADQTSGAGWFNGDDAVVLRKGTTIVDAFGQIGFDPGSQWGSGLVSTADNTLRRKADVCGGDPDGSDVFDPALEWDGFATDTFDGLGAHATSCGGVVDVAPAVASSLPADGSYIAAGNANLGVTFTEPVTAGASSFTLVCTAAGSVDLVVTGGDTVFEIDPVTDLPERDACTLTVHASQVTDLDGTPDAMEADAEIAFQVGYQTCGVWVLPTYAIQGSGAVAAITGPVTTGGVVVGDFEGPSPTLRGFYLQDPVGDGDPATSDGIFVFHGNADTVNLGDLVTVSGTAGEFQDQTQLSNTNVTVCGTGSVDPVDVTLPVPSADYLERYEGMLVRFPQTLHVTEMFQLGRFGQVVMSTGGRLRQPTAVALPGAPAQTVQAENDLNRIIVDDDRNDQNPDPIVFGGGGDPLTAANPLRGGDTVSGMVGVLTYTWAGNSASGNAYRLRPVSALGGGVPAFVAANPRPLEPVDVGGGVRVATLNVLNYFTTFQPRDYARGAEDDFEFDRQAAKLVATLAELDADVVGLMEIENDGASVHDLVARVNAVMGPGAYAAIDTGVIGADAIAVALVYRPANVVPVGPFAVLDDTVDPGFRDAHNRPVLAQTFASTSTGAHFTVAVNHLKSKGSDCLDVNDPDTGDGQGNCNLTRLAGIEAQLAWLATDPTGANDPDVLIIGDLNAYEMEAPIRTLEDAGYVDLQAMFGGSDAYTYVFDGQWGRLDYVFASPSMAAQVTGAAAWHTNADEASVLDYNVNFKSPGQIVDLFAPDAYRASDHDPVLAGLDLGGPNCAAATPSRATLWPVNHKFVPVMIDVPHPDGADVSLTIDAIFQDEPVDAPGGLDGATAPDGSGVGTDTASLRAERYEGGNGRVYHVLFTAIDENDQACSGTVSVRVPSSQGRNGTAVDDGPLYDSTVP